VTLQGFSRKVLGLLSGIGSRFSARSVADEWLTQLLRQGAVKVFKKYSKIPFHLESADQDRSRNRRAVTDR